MKNILQKLLAVKSKMGKVEKGADNPFFKSKYADLNTHLELIEPLLSENGLVLLQPVETDALGDKVVTRILDVESGEEVRSEMHLVLAKQDMQNAGAAITYGRRFTLGSLLAMQAIDDDGETAVGRGNQSSKPAWSKPKSSPKKEAVKAEPKALIKDEPKPFTRDQVKKSNGSAENKVVW